MKFKIAFVFISLLVIGCAVYPISTFGWKHQAKSDPFIDAEQTGFFVDLKKGYAVITGYKPNSNKRILPSDLVELVNKDQLCKSMYDFEALVYVGERLYKANDSISAVECIVRFSNPDGKFSLIDLFSHLFRKNVVLNGGDEEIGIIYYWDPIVFGPGNDVGHPSFEDKDGKITNSIWWKLSEGNLKGIFSEVVKGYDFPIELKSENLVESPSFKSLKKE
jgi:hypothetical protein